ncbi:MAG: hypothetical protein QXL82_02450 [Candidatus Aenigmatarchaeota archaeon]
MKEKIIFSIIPLFLLALIIFLSSFLTKKEFIISEIRDLECDNLIPIGSKLDSINDKKIESKNDFENAINNLKINQSFFLIVENKIIRCVWKNNSKIDVIETITKPINYGTNLERLYIENTENNKKFLRYLGYSNFIEDGKYIILPYDNKLYLLSNLKYNISFFIERTLNIENNSVYVENRLVNLEDLHDLFDEVIITENNVTVRKFLFDQNALLDFDYRLAHLTYINVYYVTFFFKINENASKILNEHLQTIPIRLINFEKYYDAKLVIKVNNNVLLEFYLPYATFEERINITLINFKDYKNVVETFSQFFLSKSEIKKESNFRLFTFDVIILFIFSSFLSYLVIKKKIEIFSMIIIFPLILSSFFFSLILSLSFLFAYIFLTFKTKRIAFDKLIIVIFSLLLSIYYVNLTYFSMFFFFFSLLIYILIEVLLSKYYKLGGILEIVFGILALSTYFFNPMISFSLLISLFAIFYRRFLSY